MPLPVPSVQSSINTSASYVRILSILLGWLLSSAVVLEAGQPSFAQTPPRRATPSGPVGASMAVLALLQDADVLPPEGTPEANRVIKVVIQFQSVMMKSQDPAIQGFLNAALTAQDGSLAEERARRFRTSGWTSEVLEALNEEWQKMSAGQRGQLEPGCRPFNVGLADFDWLMELVTRARTAFAQQGRNIHRVFAERRHEMPGGAP